MLRLDPGEDRIHTARSFRVNEGGGEYNVARNLSRCFGQRTSIVTALADNQIGRLVDDLISQGGVGKDHIIWCETDGISSGVRNGLYFMERGFGVRQPVGCSDRANTAVSQLKPGDIDWNRVFVKEGTRWFHTGGIFAGLSDSTFAVALEAMTIAKNSGVIVSYDLNYRDSLWAHRGGREAADRVNSELLKFADVTFGVDNFLPSFSEYSEGSFQTAAAEMMSRFPDLLMAATTLRDVKSASCHDLSGVCFADSKVYEGRRFPDLAVLDRVGSGDAFAAGIIYGMLSNRDPQAAVDFGTASAALSLSATGDGSSATLTEIERLIRSSDLNAIR
ncbi:MAG: sugar kinase [Saprospiraceae bacterium]|nr:sugar kinase [Pyrinomonadaceae bacterium]